MDEILNEIFDSGVVDSFTESMDGMSEASLTLFEGLYLGLFDDGMVVPAILQAISEIISYALPVAGAILVVTLGWRMFRNFTRG